MSEQEKKQQKILVCLTLKPSQSLFVFCIQNKENIFTEKELF